MKLFCDEILKSICDMLFKNCIVKRERMALMILPMGQPTIKIKVLTVLQMSLSHACNNKDLFKKNPSIPKIDCPKRSTNYFLGACTNHVDKIWGIFDPQSLPFVDT